jgi:RND family efflux transporter MFP subunit
MRRHPTRDRGRLWRPVAALLLLALHVPAPRPAFAQGGFDCLIEPNAMVAVGFAVDGLVETVTVDRGDLVRAGQVLATLESSVERSAVALAIARSQIESQLKSSRVRLEFGQRRWVRTEELYRKDLVPLKELDEAETQKVLAEIGIVEAAENQRLAELELDRAKAALALRTIRSPFDGVVVERALHPGELVKQGPVLKLAQLDPLRVEVIVPVAQLGKIGVGMRADVSPEAPVSGVYPAHVKVVDRVVDAASGTFGVRLELPNPDYRLPAGLKCKVRFGR